MSATLRRFKEDQLVDLSDEEGFYSTKIEIKKSNQGNSRSNSVHTKTNFNRQPFQAKQLAWTAPMKKQPVQVFTVTSALMRKESEEQKPQKKKTKIINQDQDHPYRLYGTNENYQLVYKRTNMQSIVNDKDFISNQIKLQHIGGKKTQGFKKLKDFDLTDVSHAQTGSLILDSKFQCGNLNCAYKNLKCQEYILFIENDTNSLGYNQWFYFSVRNNQPNVEYTFKIVNLKKKHSFFKYGCKPAVFSLAEAKLKGDGWSKKAKNVVYEQSPIYLEQLPERKFYCLSFSVSFQHKNDYIMIAMALPYSYSKMVSFLKEVQMQTLTDQGSQLQFKIKSVCTSISGNDIPEVTITRKSEERKKKMILILARQHPGQIWSSYMVEGMIRKLVAKPDQQIEWLLDNYVFKIYPMVNVDGVIYGNFRCDLTGYDLNRRWKDTSKLMHPQIYQIKRKISLYKDEYKIQCCFDLHGHSKNYNIFCYSCKDNQQSCRILPLLINKVNPRFHFPSCTFGISRYKETTARACIYKMIKTENVLTIESSFYGSKINNVVEEFGPQHIFQMGADILVASQYFFDKGSTLLETVKKEIQHKIYEFLKYDQLNELDPGSESDPSGDQIQLEVKLNNNIFDKALLTMSELNGEERPESKQIIKKKSQIKIKSVQSKIQIKGHQLIKTKHQSIKSKIGLKRNIRNIPNKSQISIAQQQKKASKLIPSQTKPIQQKKKHTISFSQQQKTVQKDGDELRMTHSSFRQRKKKLFQQAPYSKRSDEQSQQIEIPPQKKLKVIESRKINLNSRLGDGIGDARLQKTIQNFEKSNQFIRKMERFVPVSVGIKGRSNLSMFEENLYNEDQNNLITVLLENKRRIEIEKIKRNVQKSTYIVERQGKVKISNRQEKVVDYKSFKQNEKISQQIRKLASLRLSLYDQP